MKLAHMARSRASYLVMLFIATFALAAVACSPDHSASTTTSSSPVTTARGTVTTSNTNGAPSSTDIVSNGTAESRVARNILILIADDFGVESSVCYGSDPATAPRLTAFCEQAVVFDNVWSSPTCSPTRAGLLTGRHSFRTGVTEQVTGENNIEIEADERTLPNILGGAESGYTTANFGKWHLGGDAFKPNEMGWDHFSGLLTGGVRDYESWTKTTNGVASTETRYATTANVDDALSWIRGQDGPWLTWIGFNAPHTPFHDPPADLHTQDLASGDEASQYRAAIEALDTEIGRLIDSLDATTRANTTIIFLGDNGTPGQVSDFPQGSAKGSLAEGGVHVPLFVWGAGVSGGRRSNALVGTVDIFSTVLELAGVDEQKAIAGEVQIDSRSFVAVLDGRSTGTKEYLLTSIEGPTTRSGQEGIAIRDRRWKLVSYNSGKAELFDLLEDPLGETPLTVGTGAAAEAFDELSSTLATWTATSGSASPNVETTASTITD